MKFEIDAKKIKEIINACSIINNECNFSIDENGWKTTVSDPGNVSMLSVFANKDAFYEYDLSSNENEISEIGLDLFKINDILKIFDDKDWIVMEIDDQAEKIVIGTDNIEYNITLLDKEYVNTARPPEINYNCNVVVGGKDFYKSCIACRKISKYIYIGIDVSNEVFYLRGDNDADSIRVTVPGSIDNIPEENIESLFSYEFLEKFVKLFNKDDMRIYIGNDYPLKIDIYGYVFLLAPRLERHEN